MQSVSHLSFESTEPCFRHSSTSVNSFDTGRTKPCSIFHTQVSGQRLSFSGVLTINVYNEQIFTVLYVWMNIVLAVTVYDFLSWLMFLLFPRLRYSFFTQRIHTQQSIATIRASMRAFVYDYLQQDGFFILRLIHSNVGDDVTSSILTNLWKNYQRPEKVSSAESSSIGATVSLTATGNRGFYSRNEEQSNSLFDYNKTSTNL